MKKTVFIILYILYSNFGLSQWISQSNPQSGSGVIYFTSYFFNSNTGFIAGGLGGVILKTSNSGSNWLATYLPNNVQVLGISFINQSTGLAVSSFGSTNKYFHRTSDGGTIWSTTNFPWTPTIWKVKFTSPDTLYCVGDSGYVIKSTNSGLNFFKLNSGTKAKLRDIYMFNNNTGFVAGDSGNVLKTTDGGFSWENQSSGTLQFILDLHFLNQQTGYYAATIGVVGKTTNSGASWSSLPIGTGADMTGIYFNSTNTGFAIGVYDSSKYNVHTVIKTTNGGNNWSRIKGGIYYLRTIFFVDDNTGWAAGDAALIYKTSTGGVTFVKGNNETVSNFNLSQNYPNPFNPTTIINYQLTIISFVILNVYDVNGRLVKELVNKKQSSGNYSIDFDGSGLPSGTYIYRLQAGEFSETKKMVLLK